MTKNWETKKLGEVCEIGAGNSAPQKKELFDGGNYPFFRTSDVGRIRFGVIDDSTDKLNEIGIKKLHLYKKGTLLFPKSGASTFLNHRVLMATDGYVSSHLATLKAKDNILDDRFLLYFSLTIDSRNLMQDQNYPSLRLSDIQEIDILLPAFPEQKRIVAILDEAFDSITKAKENAEKNLQNARELFESYLNSIFANPGDGWERCNIEDYIKFIDYRGRTPKKTETGLHLITAKNVKSGYLQLEPQEFINPDDYDDWMTRGIPKFGDVIFTTEAPLANVAQLDTREKVAFAQRIIVMQPQGNKINQTFLKYILLSSPIRQKILAKGTGATVQGIKARLLKKIEIYFPSTIIEQKRIVAKLDALSTETKKLENIYQQKLADLEELKKTILQKAFNGELTASTPIQLVSNTVSFPEKLTNINTTDLHAGILAMAYQEHENSNRTANFGHVKAEKIAHMIEAFAGIDLDRIPVKDAAGPNDFRHLKKVEHRARMTNCFDFQRTAGGAYRVCKLRGFERLIEKTRTALGAHLTKVEHILDLMLPLNVLHAEVVATLFAAWNNLLLDGKQPTDEEIVYEARENWHPDKLKIEREYFFKTIEWMRKKNIIPKGKGKRVVEKAA